MPGCYIVNDITEPRPIYTHKTNQLMNRAERDYIEATTQNQPIKYE